MKDKKISPHKRFFIRKRTYNLLLREIENCQIELINAINSDDKSIKNAELRYRLLCRLEKLLKEEKIRKKNLHKASTKRVYRSKLR